MNSRIIKFRGLNLPAFPAGRYIKRGLMGLLGGVAILSGMGALYQTVATQRDLQNYPPPGRLVEVEGTRLHLNVMGEDKSGPTVILEAGLSGMSAQWGWVQPEVAKFARVVAYDRPGLGWSDTSSAPHDGASAIRQLHIALQQAGIQGPYVLVGHSYGGPLARLFAEQYPDEVLGIVFVDASHPDQFPVGQKGLGMYRWLPLLGRLGVLRLTGLLAQMGQGLPPQQYGEGAAILATVKHLSATQAEASAWDTTMAQVRQTGGLGDKPLIVLSTGTEGMPGWYRLQADLATLSSRGEWRVVEGSNHISLVTHQKHALTVVQAIRELFEQVTL